MAYGPRAVPGERAIDAGDDSTSGHVPHRLEMRPWVAPCTQTTHSRSATRLIHRIRGPHSGGQGASPLGRQLRPRTRPKRPVESEAGRTQHRRPLRERTPVSSSQPFGHCLLRYFNILNWAQHPHWECPVRDPPSCRGLGPKWCPPLDSPRSRRELLGGMATTPRRDVSVDARRMG